MICIHGLRLENFLDVGADLDVDRAGATCRKLCDVKVTPSYMLYRTFYIALTLVLALLATRAASSGLRVARDLGAVNR